MRLQYTWGGETPQLAIVKSHWKRRRICAYLNEQDKGPGSIFIKSMGLIKGASSQPQDMHLKPGTTMIGCAAGSKKILSGIEYAVESVNELTVAVTMRRPWRTSDLIRASMNAKELEATVAREDNIVLDHMETSRWLRLGYAITYYSVEGRTIPERVILLLDTGNKHFTVRNLIVGLSRSPLGKMVMIPPLGPENIWLAGKPHVPEEVDTQAEPEVFQPEMVEV